MAPASPAAAVLAALAALAPYALDAATPAANDACTSAGLCGADTTFDDPALSLIQRTARLHQAKLHDAGGSTDSASSSQTCQDLARFDSAKWTDADGFGCNAYCGSGNCGVDSFQRVLKVSNVSVPTYIPGMIGKDLYSYLNTDMMKQSPLITAAGINTDVMQNCDMGKKHCYTPGYTWISGKPWSPTTSFPLAQVAADINYTGNLSKLSGWTGAAPPYLAREICRNASIKTGYPTYLWNDTNRMCNRFPKELIDVFNDDMFSKMLTPMGEYLRDTSECVRRWRNGTYYLYVPPANWTCYVSLNDYFLRSANYEFPHGWLVKRFNLGADAACCCCGGGTKGLQPGEILNVKSTPSTWALAVTTTPPGGDLELKDGIWFTDGLSANGGLPFHYKELFPLVQKIAQSTLETGLELPVTVPQVTYPPEEPGPYPYFQGATDLPNGTCEDYTLGRHIVNESLQMSADPSTWMSYNGRTCKWFYYAQACQMDGSLSASLAEQLTPLSLTWNGQIKRNTSAMWTQPLNNFSTIRVNHIMAMPSTVCCACGGGLKTNKEGPAYIVDPHKVDFYYKGPKFTTTTTTTTTVTTTIKT